MENSFHLLIILLKIAASSCILFCLSWAITIEREELKNTPYQRQTKIAGMPYDLFTYLCPVPEARAVHVTDAETLMALDLPNGTLIDAELRRYGQCLIKLVKTDKIDKFLHLCSCGHQTVYFALVTVAFGSVVMSIVEAVVRVWRLTDKVCVVAASVSFLFWLPVSILISVNHALWFDDVWLPDHVYGQPYFRRPILWSTAVVLSWLCASLTVVETYQYTPDESPLPSKNAEDKSRASDIAQDDAEIRMLCRKGPRSVGQLLRLVLKEEDQKGRRYKQICSHLFFVVFSCFIGHVVAFVLYYFVY